MAAPASGPAPLQAADTHAHLEAQLFTSQVVFSGFLIFFMQVGFVALEMGSGRAKNVRNILLKNLVDVMLAAMAWWAVGYAFAYGNSAGGVIGTSFFFFEAEGQATRPWFFSWTFCVAACTIVSGCLAERTRLVVYPAFTVAIAAFVHPVLVHWLWAADSWLARLSECRPLDFAGGTVVHMIGGLFGIVGAVFVGPRLGRFEEGVVKDMPGHDMGWVTIGTLSLWFGWYGFNTGSTYLYASPSPLAAQRAAMNTTLAASSSGLVSLLLGSWLGGTYDLRLCCNGVLSGLVTVTAMCGFVDPYAAVVGGVVAGAAYIGFSRLVLRLGVDDPLDSGAVHYGNGLLGTMMLALFAKPEHVAALVGTPCGGVFYTRKGWLQLGMQTLAATLVTAFAGAVALAVFGVLRRLQLLRVEMSTELAGLDNMEHGGPAYEWNAAAQERNLSDTGMQ
ncbi:ammonium transporter [Raphidocelis subcapitata]|uniref:Ammonium transporter n=1 Tax=Raphidocelis subcapitata TaxID=307507 RepID=A0A2V0PH50_9CHLO|nr:ammonium transporter [Raphidocelis subcapitata]|eukprot:GBF97250.1 ammonium transporter [Raphidocelis subcapitata]